MTFSWVLCLLCAVSVHAETVQSLAVREALDRARGFSPELKAASARESETRSRIGVAESSYYPSIALEAIDSTGFPGSTGELGIGGLMGSPFRSGLAAGAVLTQDIFDFGRTSFAVKASKFEAEAQEHATEIDAYRVEQEVLQAYFDCALNRTEGEEWQVFLQDTELVEQQVEIFIKTGQRSIVDRYLSRAQKENAKTHVLDYRTRESVSLERLAVITGIGRPFVCPSLEALSDDLQLRAPPLENPLVAFAKTQRDVAQAKWDQVRAENYPIVLGIASVGYLEGAHLLNTQDYSLGVGVQFPLFEGFRISRESDLNAARVEEREYEIQNSRFTIADLDRQFDEKIRSADTRRTELAEELKTANAAFVIAKRRYLSLQGTLVDLRDSVSNLERVVDSLATARAEYLQFASLEAVLNGAR